MDEIAETGRRVEKGCIMDVKVYLSGKITGEPNYKEYFKEAENLAKSVVPHLSSLFETLHASVAVLNPAVLPLGMSERDYMRIAMAMLDCSDYILMLDNWEDSEGAKVEKLYAEKVGTKVLYCAALRKLQRGNKERE